VLRNELFFEKRTKNRGRRIEGGFDRALRILLLPGDRMSEDIFSTSLTL